MQPKKKTSPIFWAALIGLAVAAYVLTTPEDAAGKPTTRRVNTRSKSTVATLVTAEDLAAKKRKGLLDFDRTGRMGRYTLVSRRSPA